MIHLNPVFCADALFATILTFFRHFSLHRSLARSLFGEVIDYTGATNGLWPLCSQHLSNLKELVFLFLFVFLLLLLSSGGFLFLFESPC